MSEASVGAFLYALNPDNTVKWKLDYTNDLNTPALSKDDTVYVGCYDGNLYAINADGSQTWNTALGNGSTSTVTPEGIVYTSTNDGCLYAFNPDGVIQ